MPGSSAGSDHSDKTVPLPPDAARDLSTGAASAPVQKQAMPDSLWKKIYARRNGQLVLLYDLENEEFLKSLAKKNNSETSSFSAKDMTYSYRSSSYASWSNLSVKSWGDFIEVACRTGLDLTGLAISPEQKKCQYEFEFQGKNLAGGKLDHAEFDGMDLSKTNFSNATMQHASLRDTTGQAPNFSSAKGLLMDLTGARYTEPNFSGMNAPRSIHFKSTYDLPTFSSTDWNGAHMVGASLFLKDGNVNLSGALAAGCLFYGMGTSIVSPGLMFNQAAFPGSCFYNVKIMAGVSYGQKGDFSPLLFDDPRLTDEEKEYMSTHGQWLNSSKAADGVKVSSEMSFDIDGQRLYSLFSESTVETYQTDSNTIFFSKGKILNRRSFHECMLANISDILPQSLRDKVEKEAKAVAVEVPKVQGAVLDFSGKGKIPAITFDRDKVAAEVSRLKKASLTEAMTVGATLEQDLAKLSGTVSSWALAKLGDAPKMGDNLQKAAGKLMAYDLDAVITAPSPPPPKPKQGFWSSLLNGPEPESPPVPVVKDLFNELSGALQALPDAMTKAVEHSSRDLADAEGLQTFLRSAESAFAAYIEEMDKITPEIETVNPAAVSALGVRRDSLETSRELVENLRLNTGALITATLKGSAALQKTQGMALSRVNAGMIKVSALHDLGVALRGKDAAYKPDGTLAGVYGMAVKPGSTDPATVQVASAFDRARRGVVDELEAAQKTAAEYVSHRTAALERMMGLKPSAPEESGPAKKALNLGS